MRHATTTYLLWPLKTIHFKLDWHFYFHISVAFHMLNFLVEWVAWQWNSSKKSMALQMRSGAGVERMTTFGTGALHCWGWRGWFACKLQLTGLHDLVSDSTRLVNKKNCNIKLKRSDFWKICILGYILAILNCLKVCPIFSLCYSALFWQLPLLQDNV